MSAESQEFSAGAHSSHVAQAAQAAQAARAAQAAQAAPAAPAAPATPAALADPLAQPGPIDVLRLEMRVRRDVQYEVIHPQRPVFDPAEHTLAQTVGENPLLVVIDRRVNALYGHRMQAYAETHLNVAGTVIIDGEEINKTWGQAEMIAEAAMACGLCRRGIIVGVGGGVTLDVSGFIASIYRRGISFLRIPTTLIGQVDVSIGIKQGVNVGRFKNILGSFHAPLASINDVSFLQSLPHAHIAAGFAEILKMALISDPVLFDLVETHGAALLASRFQHPRVPARIIMERAETAMLRELQDNLFEAELKRLVDFGHTFSPAIESASAYRVLHGHAVALDMVLSTCIAVERAICRPQVLERLLHLHAKLELPVSQEYSSAAELHQSLASIRAHRGGALNLVVPVDIGNAVFLQDITLRELEHALRVLADCGVTNVSTGL